MKTALVTIGSLTGIYFAYGSAIAIALHTVWMHIITALSVVLH